MNKPPKWLERAKETYKFHRIHVLADDKWTLTQTAAALRRSLGGICEDIKIAQWLKTHEAQIEKFEYIYECLRWIRQREKEMKMTEID